MWRDWGRPLDKKSSTEHMVIRSRHQLQFSERFTELRMMFGTVLARLDTLWTLGETGGPAIRTLPDCHDQCIT